MSYGFASTEMMSDKAAEIIQKSSQKSSQIRNHHRPNGAFHEDFVQSLVQA